MKKLKKNKITIICFGFSKKSIRNQPWYTTDKICEKLYKKGFKINLITDTRKYPKKKYNIVYVEKLFNFNSPTYSLKNILKKLNPSFTIIITGSHEILFPGRFSSLNNVILAVANNRFYIKELKRISFLNFIKERELLLKPMLSSLIPGFLIKIGFYLSGAINMIFFSREAQNRYRKIGLPSGILIQPFFETKKNISPNIRINYKKINLCYFGPPLFLRGIDIVLNVFEKIALEHPSARLKLLIRYNKENSLKRNMLWISKVINNHKFKNNIIFDKTYYSKSQFDKEIKKNSINILPFKITVSDAPLVIIDAIKSGVPLFTLDTPGVSENIIGPNGFIAQDEEEIVFKIKKFIKNKRFVKKNNKKLKYLESNIKNLEKIIEK